MDAKHYVDTHLPGTLIDISCLADLQLAEHRIACSSIAGLSNDNGAFKRVCVRLSAMESQSSTVCQWLAMHCLKLERLRYDHRLREFVLFVIPAVPVLEGVSRRIR